MTYRKKKASLVNSLLVTFILTSLVFVPTLTQSPSAAESSRVSVNISPTALQIVVAELKESELISIDVADPNDKILHEESKQSPLSLTLAVDAVEGPYRYDVQIVDQEGGISVDHFSGMFEVKNGQITLPDAKGQQSMLHKAGKYLARAASYVMDVIVPTAEAADLTAESVVPTVNFFDSNPVAGGASRNVWYISASEAVIPPCANANTDILLRSTPLGNSGTPALAICSRGTNANSSMVVDYLGDIHLANDGMFFDRSARLLGIGLTTPATTIDAIGNEIRLRPSTAAGAKLITMRVNGSANDLNSYFADLWIRSDFTGNNTYLLQNRLGIGTTAPAANTHVVGTTFPTLKTTRQVAFTDGGRGVAAYELKSSGNMVDGFGPSFEFWISDNTYTASLALASMEAVREGADNSGRWVVRTANAGILGLRLLVNHVGQVGVGREPRAGTAIDTSTNAYLSTGGVWVNFSSRQGKDNIRDLDTEKAMQTLEGLNPVTFTYKAAPEEHHVGFIAEDVPEIVATQERRGLSALDITAVLTKVVQEQQKTMQEQQETIKRLTERMAALERDMKLRGTIASLTDSR